LAMWVFLSWFRPSTQTRSTLAAGL
jgi:hypothetical protein